MNQYSPHLRLLASNITIPLASQVGLCYVSRGGGLKGFEHMSMTAEFLTPLGDRRWTVSECLTLLPASQAATLINKRRTRKAVGANRQVAQTAPAGLVDSGSAMPKQQAIGNVNATHDQAAKPPKSATERHTSAHESQGTESKDSGTKIASP